MPHQPLNQGFSARTRSRRLHVDWKGYASALAVTLLATGIGWPLHHHLWLANTNVLMLFLLSVLWVATRHSRSAAVLASLLGVAAFNFFFVPPHLTFIVSERQYFFTFAVMLATALVISALTHRVRLQAETARQRETRTAAMFALSRQLAAARTAEEIVSATLRNVTDLLGVRTVICLPGATPVPLLSPLITRRRWSSRGTLLLPNTRSMVPSRCSYVHPAQRLARTGRGDGHLRVR